MDNDLNVSSAIASVLKMVSEGNKLISKKELSKKGSKLLLKELMQFDSVMGILDYDEKIPKEILKKVEEREKARKSKDWKKADKIRDELAAKGYEVQDSEDGPKVVIKFQIGNT